VHLRSESYTSQTRIPQVSLGTPLEDALRRDLTVNALFYNVHSGLVEDFTGKGLSDMQQRVARTPLEARITLLDDPLRALRAVRFASRLRFQLHEELLLACREEDVRLALKEKVSCERVLTECTRMFELNGLQQRDYLPQSEEKSSSSNSDNYDSNNSNNNNNNNEPALSVGSAVNVSVQAASYDPRAARAVCLLRSACLLSEVVPVPSQLLGNQTASKFFESFSDKSTARVLLSFLLREYLTSSRLSSVFSAESGKERASAKLPSFSGVQQIFKDCQPSPELCSIFM
jgi:hypothetical protein